MQRNSRLVAIIGQPGSGKSTQAALLASRAGGDVVRPDEVLREVSHSSEAFGELLADHLRQGNIPAHLLAAAIDDHLARQSPSLVVLDGVPATVAQARALAEVGLAPDVVIHLLTPDRMVARRQAHDAVGPADGDGAEASLRRRAQHEGTIRPVRDWYAERGALVTVDGTGSRHAVARDVAAIAGAVGGRGRATSRTGSRHAPTDELALGGAAQR